MRQYARNACGTIALFHIVLNAVENHPTIVTQGSYLDSFRVRSLAGNAVERGQIFKNSHEILE
jgi:hypothetical protein